MPTKQRPARVAKKGPHSRAMAAPQPLHVALPAVNYHVEDAAHLRALMAANPGLLDMMNQLHNEGQPVAPVIPANERNSPRRINIPTRFTLGAVDVEVILDPELWGLNCTSAGLAAFCNQQIVLQANVKHCPRPRQLQEKTFCHELAHYILWSMDHDLMHNEAFVDHMGRLLHQFLATATGEVRDA